MDLGVSVKDISCRRSSRRRLAGLVAVLAVAAAGAQVPTQLPPLSTPVPGTVPQQAPTAEQLQMLQQLPESERQALMQSLGIPAGSVPGQAPTGTQLQQPAPVVAPQVPRFDEEQTGPPVLEAGSTVIVKLRLPRANGDVSPDAQRRAQAAAGTAPTVDEELGDLRQLARLEGGQVDPEIERLFQQRVQRNPQLGGLL